MSAATNKLNTLQSRALLTAMLMLGCVCSLGCRSFYDRTLPPPPPVSGVNASIGVPAVEGIAPVVTGPPAVVNDPRMGPPNVAPPASSRLFGGWRNNAKLTLTPQTVVAPVGSEVVLVGGIVNDRGKGAVSERIDWMLSPDSVGQFVAVDKSPSCLLLRFPSNRPRKITNSFAVSSTTTSQTLLGRGTETSQDNITVEPGQTWITVSSPTDGTSHVTAFAPHVPAWDLRKQNATIYWVDAQFSFPAPTIAPVGERQSLTTVVTRLSDGSPLEGFVVRYQLGEEGNIGFAPNGATAIEVPTDAAGRATVEVFQQEPLRSENQIQIEVVRPAGVAGAADRSLTIGRGSTSVTWTAPGVNLELSGPTNAEVGSQVTYRITVSNTGDLPLHDVIVSSRVPNQLQYESSSLAAESEANSLKWQFSELGSGQTETIVVNYKVIRAGPISNCISVINAERVEDKDCVSTNAALPVLELNVTGPDTATVGEQVTYAISITNRSTSTLNNLIIKNTFDEGLKHAVAVSPIERDLGALAPGQTRSDIGVTFEVTKPGRICQTVEIVGQGIQAARRTICLTVNPGSAALPGALRVEKRGPKTGRVGETIIFDVVVANTGETALNDVKVIDTFERGLEPSRVSDGYRIEEDQLTWQFDKLAPGESQQLQVEVLCKQAVRSCTRVTVTAADLVVADEVCVQIEPALEPPAVGGPLPADRTSPPTTSPQPEASGKDQDDVGIGDVLSLNVSDLRDEVPVGSNIIYEVTVTNLQNITDSEVVVVLTVPEGLAPTSRGVGIVAPSNPNISGRIIRFNPVAEIRPGESLIYRVPIRAEQAGQFRSQIRVNSNSQRRPLIRNEDSSVYSEN
jgi:uncharacterized repeat protein (TIGR01451 family)